MPIEDIEKDDCWWMSDICTCSRCKEARLRQKMKETVEISRQTFVDFLVGYKKIKYNIAMALVDRYWGGVQSSTGMAAMLDVADRIVAGEILYDTTTSRFYTEKRLYI